MLSVAVAASILAKEPEPMPFVSPLFGDNMVMQRGKKDAIWGWTNPGAEVTVSIAGKTDHVTAGTDGKWMAHGPSMPAGGSYKLKIKGPQTLEFKNVTFGDVWICGGQSNMEFGVGNLIEGKKVIAEANNPNIRLFYVPDTISINPNKTVKATWRVCTPASIASSGDWGGFSAVGYFFGRKLNHDLKVPIGLIHDNWGGTVAEAWTPEAPLIDHLPEFKTPLQSLKEAYTSEEPFESRMDKWYAANDLGSSSTPAWSTTDLDDSTWETVAVPGFVQKSDHLDLNNQQSIFWMRRTFEVAPNQSLSGAKVHFVVDDDDTTWINGVKVGATNGWNTHRAYAIPDGVLHAGTNSVVVRVTDSQAPGGIWDDGGYGTYIDMADKSHISLEGTWKAKLATAITDKNPLPVSILGNPNQPTVLYNGMIAPLAPFGVKGAIWYQGEANVGRAEQYKKLLPTMINGWRDAFGQGDFPFLIVQLAGYGTPPALPGDDAWAELREAQEYAASHIRAGGLATAVDVGESGDIHPKNKQEVGRRLALVAEAKFYDKPVSYEGPKFKKLIINDGGLVVSFSKKLKTSDGGKPKGFAIAGSDHKWHWADALIVGKDIFLTSTEETNPTEARYAWSDFAELNLQGEDGLPVLPFRTDKPVKASKD